MEVDPEYVRSYYSSLSDEGLREIDRADLSEAAQKCYDNEVGQRRLHLPGELPAPRTAEGGGGIRYRF